MTTLEKFLALRSQIATALVDSGLAVQFNKDDVPKSLPVGIIVLTSEDGTLPTNRRYTSSDLAFTIYLVINAQDVPDPDHILIKLKESFRAAYQTATGRDFPHVEYYSSRVDGSRPVRIAKIDLLKSGSGVAS